MPAGMVTEVAVLARVLGTQASGASKTEPEGPVILTEILWLAVTGGVRPLNCSTKSALGVIFWVCAKFRICGTGG